MMSCNSLFLSKLPPKTTWEIIQSEFQRFGEVDHIRYKNGNERGLVRYFNPQDAEKAFNYFHQNTFLGRKINIVFNVITKVVKELPQEVSEIRVKELDDVVEKEREILEILKTSWDDFSSTTPQPQDILTFDEILQCLDKIPYEMAQPWKHPSFQEDIQKMCNYGEQLIETFPS